LIRSARISALREAAESIGADHHPSPMISDLGETSLFWTCVEVDRLFLKRSTSQLTGELVEDHFFSGR
jgi:hypothetical protein